MARRRLRLVVKPIASVEPVEMDPELESLLTHLAVKIGITSIRMQSGALHDAATMASIVPTGMIFVPSVGGKSHCPEEFTKTDDIVLGCRLLIEAIKTLSQS